MSHFITTGNKVLENIPIETLRWKFIFPNLLPGILWASNVFFYVSFFLGTMTINWNVFYLFFIFISLVMSVFVWGTSGFLVQIHPRIIDRFRPIKDADLNKSNHDERSKVILFAAFFNFCWPFLVLAVLFFLLGKEYLFVSIPTIILAICSFLLSVHHFREAFIVRLSKMKPEELALQRKK